MSDRKFTDDDVIKAYELCFTPKGTNETCAKCPFHKIGLLCKIERDRAAFALINRQKAKIESLTKVFYELKMEAEMVYKQRDAQKNRADSIAKFARAEGIKDFAKRLKAAKIKPEFPWDDFYVTESTIDNLVKEMTEANDGKEGF